MTPEHLYERQWALALLDLTLDRLRQEYPHRSGEYLTRPSPVSESKWHMDWLGTTGTARYLLFMSIAELKSRIAELSFEERLELAALITHLNRKDDPEYQAELSRRMAAMNDGKKVRQADLERLHRDLDAQGG